MDEQDDGAAGTIELRRGQSDDLPAMVELGRLALGWSGEPDDAERFRWKHFENPFGTSPMWIARDGERVVGLRAFLRWELVDRDGRIVRAVRAVDTATDPAYQGRGIFTRLTRGALDELREDGVRLVFNTPNTQSLPGYLKMGWSKVGRLPVSVMLGRVRSAPLLATARQPASRSSIDSPVGEPAAEVLADERGVRQLLSTQPRRAGFATASSPEYLSWRYGYRPLRYRAVLHGSSAADGLVVFRLRRRGRAVEAAICEVLVPGPDAAATRRSLLRRIARETQATYLLRLGAPLVTRDRFLRVPGAGPILACRRLDGERVPSRRDWELTLGDVELL